MQLHPLLRRLGMEVPIVQAGMGGGLARHELAAAVSRAGGLGTVGLLEPAALADEIAAARRATSGPVAVNLLLPFARRRHWRAAEGADAVVTFWGRPRRRTTGVWLHQCGSPEEAGQAVAAGADGVIVQGVEAGGHVRGRVPALDLVRSVREELPDRFPVVAAGGIADAEDVARASAAGADAAALGTRFLMTEQSRAHPRYLDALTAAGDTLLTELFGLGWPALHRVIPNAATRRWVEAPGAVRAFNRVTSPAVRTVPESLQKRLVHAQRPGVPLLSPLAPTDDLPEGLVEASPLYAGRTVARIDDVRDAGALVRHLVDGSA